MTTNITRVSPVILSLENAQRMTERAIQRAAEVAVPYTISVLDGAGNLVLATRMDGAALASIDTSVAKARTAVFFGAATQELAPLVANGQPLATVEAGVAATLAFVAGGVPVRDSTGVVVGAVGAGGAAPEQDHLVAAAGAAAYRG